MTKEEQGKTDEHIVGRRGGGFERDQNSEKESIEQKLMGNKSEAGFGPTWA